MLMDSEEISKKLANMISPSKIYDNFINTAKKTAGIATIEGQIIIDQMSTQFNNVVNQFMETISKHYNEFMHINKENLIDIIKSYYMYKQPQFIQLYRELNTHKLSNSQQLHKIKEFVNSKAITNVPPYNAIQSGGSQKGGNPTDFMKYVYTKKSIWFTKKDMIWN
jgi:hypothetical protein